MQYKTPRALLTLKSWFDANEVGFERTERGNPCLVIRGHACMFRKGSGFMLINRQTQKRQRFADVRVARDYLMSIQADLH